MKSNIPYVSEREQNALRAAERSRLLPNEVMGWKQMVTEIYRDGPDDPKPLITKIYCQEDIPRLRSGPAGTLRVSDVVGFWGWLSPEAMGDTGDKWRLHFNGNGVASGGWGKVELPQNWDGELNNQVWGGEIQPRVVVGDFYWGDKRKFWAAECGLSGTPVLPKLREGEYMYAKPEELSFLGVLSLPWNGTSKTRCLVVAWGDQGGEFLGWERAESMGEVREYLAGLGWERAEGPLEAQRRLAREGSGITWGQRMLGPLGDFEEIDKMLRQGSWGREL